MSEETLETLQITSTIQPLFLVANSVVLVTYKSN